MNKEFWVKAWDDRNIGFHMPKPSPVLLKYSKKYFKDNSTVLVPLCGKSLDLIWLKEQGYNVIGVEIAPRAISEFFKESGLDYTTKELGPYKKYTSGNLTILEGSIFDLDKIDLQIIDSVWDRASIVALPKDLRERYIQTLLKVLNPKTNILMATLEQTDVLDFGPPFHVGREEVEQGYRKTYSKIEIIDESEDKAQGRFKEAGIKKMKRVIYILKN